MVLSVLVKLLFGILSFFACECVLAQMPPTPTTPDSTMVVPPNVQPVPPLQNQILVWDLGFVDFQNISSQNNPFYTHQQCPNNYHPYILLVPNKVWEESNSLLGFRICLTWAPVQFGNVYQVYFETYVQYQDPKSPDTAISIAFNWVLYCIPNGYPFSNQLDMNRSCWNH